MERDGDSIWPKRSESEKRRMRARLLYDFEMECRRQEWGDPAFVYDEGKDLFRFTDGPSPFLQSTLTGSCSKGEDGFGGGINLR